ncbi:hypothetical protein VNO78_21191 [Psophocarpus tetragonolobus]|uniref:MATH domain-containing protein n=1 Tax=Psophocarpus tetragonolobus TaxID=3891 RepID=A0AAN9SCB4_PSOTE
MDIGNTDDEMFEKYTWTIRNFSTLDSKKLYSDKFVINDHTWRILIFPKGNKVDYLSIYLDGGGDRDNLPNGWNKFAQFKVTLTNQVNYKKNETKETQHMFDAKQDDWGYSQFMPLKLLCGSSCGFIVNDTCIIEVEVLVKKSQHENQVDQSVNVSEDRLIEWNDESSSKNMISTSFGKLVDFKSMGNLDQVFVPLLEEVCLRHPSLVNNNLKTSQRFIEWAFTALGRVLYFLKSKKVRDMDKDACNHLKILWEELEVFRFDLTWLEPYVKSALNMNTFVEKVGQVKKLKEKVEVLEKLADLEREAKLTKKNKLETKVELEITKIDLMEAKEDYEDKDLDAELGYGIP